MVARYPLSAHAPSPSATLTLEDSSVKIWLPSALLPEDRNVLLSSSDPFCKLLVSSEIALRIANLQDNIDAIQRHLRSKLAAKDRVKRGVRSQRYSTRSNAVFSATAKKVHEKAARYRRSYKALGVLDASGGWRKIYLVLEDVDLRMPFSNDDKEWEKDDSDTSVSNTGSGKRKATRTGKRNSNGQGLRVESWIWSVGKASSSDPLAESNDGEHNFPYKRT